MGDVPPLYLVMPLTIEPSTPRLRNDNRFLNLWIRDMPFKLDSLTGLPRYVFPSSFQSFCDDKSGCDHVLLSLESHPYPYQYQGGLSPCKCLRCLFVVWTSTLTAKFSLHPGVARPRNRTILLMSFCRIFEIVSTYNIHINLCYISSADNPADTPSRVFPLHDSKLSPSAWAQVQAEFGGRSSHSADLMALTSNLQGALDGPPFPSFPHIPFLALLGSISLSSILIIMVAFFQTPMFFPPLSLSHRFCGLSELTVLLVLLLFLMSDLANFRWPLFQSYSSLLLAPRVLRA